MYKLIFIFLFLLLTVSFVSKDKIMNAVSQSADIKNNNFVTSTPEYAAPKTAAQLIADSLSIQNLRVREYPGSDFKIEQTLASKPAYNQYIVSYLSDGLKIFGHLTVPKGKKPEAGWPAIVFLHGYIPPEVYTTTGRYVAYVDYFARNGYVVFKPDYRGHGKSEGLPESSNYAPGYTIDVLNALSSVRRYKEVNKDKVGMWGHSMGGNLTLRSLVINNSDIKAAVIWAGVVAPYKDIMFSWPDNPTRPPHAPSPRDISVKFEYRKKLMEEFGSPTTSPEFWNSIDPNTYIADINAPVQIHTGSRDLDVPMAFSEGFNSRLKAAGKTTELFVYKGGDHNISGAHFSPAMQRSVTFFNKYLK